MKQIIIALLVSLLACPALARPLYRLPPGERLQAADGTYQGYTLEEMKVLLKMDVDLEFYEVTQLPKIKKELDETKKIIQAKDDIIKSKDVQLDLANKDRSRLTEKWTQENKLRHECENKPRFGSWVAWTIAAVTGAAAIALGITLAVRESK